MISDGRIGEPKNRSALQNMILAYIKEHPSVKLSAIERGVRASRIEVAEAIQELTQQGELRRDEETREYNLVFWQSN